VTFEKLLKFAYKKTKDNQKEEEAAKLLLMELSNQDPHLFFLNLKNEVDPIIEKDFLEKLDLYIHHHVPVQHLIGHSYFYGHKLIVNNHVLIPRGETEQLVEHVLFYYDKYFNNDQLDVLDLGTGSGCIGLTLSLEEKNLNVTISDISKDALDVATKNRDNLSANAQIILSDLFDNIKSKFDIIVSNPPYIPDNELVDLIVEKEPSVALYGGTLGTDFYKKILDQSKSYIKEKGLIAFEHGYQQRNEIFTYAKQAYPNGIIIQLKDLAGKDRFTFVGIGGVLSQE
jgi:release factor glutamine methyltransferase